MALTYTPAPELGSSLPEFSLKGIDDKIYSKSQFSGSKPLVVMFICNHCPYVKAVEDRLIALGREFKSTVNFLAICSNDSARYPDDSFENLKKRALEKNYPFPYLHDETQKAAHDFGAVCTPDFFVYQNTKLSFRGRLDDSWKDATKVTKTELKDALVALLAGRAPSTEQPPSMGCSIKWVG